MRQHRQLLRKGQREVLAALMRKLHRCARLEDARSESRRRAGAGEPVRPKGPAGSEVHGLVAECLGELGAVDPDVLAIGGGATSAGVTLVGRLAEPGGGVVVIKSLVAAFRSARDTKALDLAATAMQQCLKLYGCTSELDGAPVAEKEGGGARTASVKQRERGAKLWALLDPSLRNMASPYLRSRYLIERSAPVVPVRPFLRHGMQQLKEWLNPWLASLTLACWRAAERAVDAERQKARDALDKTRTHREQRLAELREVLLRRQSQGFAVPAEFKEYCGEGTGQAESGEAAPADSDPHLPAHVFRACQASRRRSLCPRESLTPACRRLLASRETRRCCCCRR